jgi:hypothetical protein
MEYLKDYYLLKNIYDENQELINIPDSKIIINNLIFESENRSIYPNENEYVQRYDEIKNKFNKLANRNENGCKESVKIFNYIDPLVGENNHFIYPLYRKDKNEKSKSIIILLHGLNEKSWDKYHTWAKKLVEITGKAVLMFPISFHINRTPPEWNEPRAMNALSKERMKIYPDIIETSFVNAAISTKLQLSPQSFFWSGLRTYSDIHKLLGQIKNGEHKYIDKYATIDFFSYSIGAFLTEILFIADTADIFKKSRAFLFCGGPTMDKMYPISKYIYDNKTEYEMTSYYVRNFENNIKNDTNLTKYYSQKTEVGLAFKSMLNYEHLKDFRENKLGEKSKNISALALAKDKVIPPNSVRETLCGKNNNIPIDVNIMDFPFEYGHVSPFPLIEHIQPDVNKCFDKVFNLAGRFLK